MMAFRVFSTLKCIERHIRSDSRRPVNLASLD